MRKEFAFHSTKLHMRSVSYYSSPAGKHTDRVIDAFIRDELSKGRYDPAISGICFQMLLELFERVLSTDLGPREEKGQKIENVC